jgi:periplasmic protein TonB
VTGRHQPFLPSLAAAAALHAGVVGWLWLRPAPAREPRRPPTVVRLATRTPPPAPAPKVAPAPEPRRIEPTPARRPSAPRPAERLARAEPPPPRAAPADAPPPPGPPPAQRRFAVSMDAVVPGSSGGVALPTTEGRTAARGDPRLPSSAPAGDNTAFAAQADVTEIDRLPIVLSAPTTDALRRYYPEAARRNGVEGNVVIELLVGESGSVERLRIVERAGNGFDEAVLAAADALRAKFRFRPAQRGGRAVAVSIPWIIKFRLDG